MKIKLFYKIFVAFLVVALIPILTTGELFTTTLENHIQQAIENEERATLIKTASIVTQTVENLNSTLKTTANYLLMDHTDRQTLQWINRLHPEIDKLVEVDLQATILHVFARYEYIQSGTQLKDCDPTTLGKPKIRFTEWANEPHICFKNPIISLVTGKHVGALFAKANVKSLFEKFISSENHQYIQYLVNADNDTIVFHPDFNLVLNNQSAKKIPIVKELHHGKILPHAIYTNLHGITVIASAIAVSGTPLYLVCETPYSEAFSLLTGYKALINKIILISILFVFVSAYFVSRAVTRPIKKLVTVTEKITGGDLEAKIDQASIPFPDEITDFSHHFKMMVAALKKDRHERDVAVKTEQETQEKLYHARKMETLGLLTGGAAHDLNNILAGILGYPELLLRKLPDNSPLRPKIEAIRQSGEKAAAIVADLLTVTRGAAAPRQICQINDIVESYFSSPEWQTLHDHNPQVTVQRHLSSQLLNVSVSVLHIKKALMNLVTNAVESIDDQGNVTVTTENRQLNHLHARALGVSPGFYVVLSVADSGSGIATENLNKIFEPFFTKKELGRSGTGLGLTIVANTVQEHHGGIQVESGPEGTVFDLYFPAIDDQKKTPCKTESTAIPTGQGETILVVDDIALQREMAQQMLTELGYRVETVASGEAAIDFLKTHTIDLIILDMIMDPGINGYETYKQIIARNPQQKAIIASGFSENHDVQETLKLGANVFIQKPYTMKSIATAVAQTLRPDT